MPGKIEKLITPLFHRFFVIRDDGSQRQKLAAQFANGDILEIGCAGKPNSLLRGTKLIGFDFVEPESNLPPNYTGFVRGDVRDLTLFFTPNSFDTIVALEVIEHLPDYCAFFSALARLIRPNGKVILSTPNPYYFSTFVANVFFKNGFSASSRGGGTAE
jgi:SAM-dependent methyltransferase